VPEIHPIAQEKYPLEVKPHYSFVTRTLIDLFLKGEIPTIREIIAEPNYGYAGKIIYQNGIVRMFKGSDIGINTSGANQIAADKGYTKYFLQRMGYQTPSGKVFLLPQYVQDLDKALSKYAFQNYARTEEIDTYIRSTIGYPCFLKPNEGSRGKGVSKCLNKQDIEATIADYQQEHINMVLVEQAVSWPDYRIVVLRDEIIACYSRRPLAVVGNGKATIRDLLLQKRTSFINMKRTALIDLDDKRIVRHLAKQNYDLETVLPRGEVCAIYDVSNLSAGGELEDFTDRLHQYWHDLCIELTAQMGLNFCGVDLACADIENASADYAILELNGSPGLDNYAANNQKNAQKVRDMYKRIFNSEGIWKDTF
jgi:D-alanine-D-alanine ligase-like ATP-grasp enzyme